MDILKSNKYLFFLFFFLLFLSSCKKKKNNQQENRDCSQDINIHFYNRNDSIPLFFNGEYEKKSLQNLKIEHIRNKKTLNDIFFRITEDDDIMLSSKIQLTNIDTLQIIFSDNERIIISNFQNTEYYGGKKKLGCYLGSCLINDKKVSINNQINIFK